MTNVEKLDIMKDEFQALIKEKAGTDTIIEFNKPITVQIFEDDDMEDFWTTVDRTYIGLKNGHTLYTVDEEEEISTDALFNILDMAALLDVIETGAFKLIETAQ